MFMEECFRSTDKSLACTLMTQLITIKFDGPQTMQEHTIKKEIIKEHVHRMDLDCPFKLMKQKMY